MAAAGRCIAIRRDAVTAVPAVRFGGAVAELREAVLPSSAGMMTVGLEEEAPAVAALPPDPKIGGYVPLPETQSLVVEPPHGTSVEEVAEALGDEYIVMPEVNLTLPGPSGTTQLLPEGEARAAVEVLPGDSGVRAAHEAGNLGEGAVVAILDTGCDADHREFAGRTIDYVWAPLSHAALRQVRGFDTATHGTHVTGIVGGANVGIAPKADLIVGAVIESEKLATTTTRIWETLNWLLRRIAEPQYTDKPVILNMSLGFRTEDIAAELLDTTMEALRLLLARFLEREKVLPVVAIGNDGPGTVRAPGYYPETLSVGAVDSSLAPWPKSGGGPAPGADQAGDLSPDGAGVGVDVISSVERDVNGVSWYGKKNGTSMAAPYAAGVAALVAAASPGLRGADLRDRLLETAHPIDAPPERVGRGLIRYAL